jgi:hypothetical protein
MLLLLTARKNVLSAGRDPGGVTFLLVSEVLVVFGGRDRPRRLFLVTVIYARQM